MILCLDWNIEKYMNENNEVLENSIANKVPPIVSQWDNDLNNKMTPENVLWQSGKKVWWKCKHGHSYDMSPNNKFKINPKTKELRIVECPYCTGKRILKGYNDISTINPEIFKEWDFDNNSLDPFTIGRGSHLKANWKCSKGHMWDAKIESRTRLGRGCPYCAGQKVLEGYNDLSTTNPELLSEWHPTKNKDITPKMINANTHKKFWWICNMGHEWEAQPHNRIEGTGCPYCSGRFAIKGENDFSTLYPQLAEEWHPTLNRIKANEVMPTSHNKVWWICGEGHEWQTWIYARVNGNGCPYCSGFKPIFGETDLATLMPEISEEWNYEKNRGKTPQMFTKSSNKKVWWKCKNEHEWRAMICDRTTLGNGCPICLKIRRNKLQKGGE